MHSRNIRSAAFFVTDGKKKEDPLDQSEGPGRIGALVPLGPAEIRQHIELGERRSATTRRDGDEK